jgi:hypothetical protein
VILITALVIIGVFTGGIENFLRSINMWYDTQDVSNCQVQCNTLCISAPEGTTIPEGYPEECNNIDCNCQTTT